MFMVQFVFAMILSLTVEKLIWSLEVNRSTSLNQRQVNRFEMGTCSLKITHPSGTSVSKARLRSLRIKGEILEKERWGQEFEPTTCDGELSLGIWSQTFVSVEHGLKVDRGIIVLPCSLIGFSLHECVESFVVSGNCKGGIFPPQEPERHIPRWERTFLWK